MNLFGKEPQEIAMQSLIHDTNAIISDLHWRVKQLDEWLAENTKQIQEAGIKTIQKSYVISEDLKTNKERLKKVIDTYYIKFKDDFKS